MRVNPTDTSHTRYYLLDLAWYRGGLRRLFETDSAPHYTLLYMYTSQASAAEHGPLLLTPSSAEVSEAFHQWVEQGIAIELISRWELDDVAHHFKTLTMARRNDALVVLRYADPRLYAGIIPALSTADQARLLGPVESMIGTAHGQAWALRQTAQAADHHVRPDSPFRLTQRHELCLQAWRERALLQPIAERHGLPLDTLIGWYQQLSAMDFETEHTRVQGCEQLASLGKDRPISESLRTEVKALSGTWSAKLAHLKTRFSISSERSMAND